MVNAIALVVGDFFAFDGVFVIEVRFPGIGFVGPSDFVTFALHDCEAGGGAGPVASPPGTARGGAGDVPRAVPKCVFDAVAVALEEQLYVMAFEDLAEFAGVPEDHRAVHR